MAGWYGTTVHPSQCICDGSMVSNNDKPLRLGPSCCCWQTTYFVSGHVVTVATFDISCSFVVLSAGLERLIFVRVFKFMMPLYRSYNLNDSKVQKSTYHIGTDKIAVASGRVLHQTWSSVSFFTFFMYFIY